ncbi:MAG: 16S rRNA (uracil(1498)-N(3))-methyltransferase [Saprospiraceae bacterium]|nr:16S rRNA (uracil(1498)-N(3))-methyltransferase [Saprospiraceae bacterium]
MILFQGKKDSLGFILVDPNEIHHCIQVTRHKENDIILVTDFSGEIYKGRIQSVAKNMVTLDTVQTFISWTPGVKISIAISLAQSSDRFEWFLEKATEIGVNEVIPLICKRTENRKNKIDRWQKIILSSSKQCLRPNLLKIHEPLKFSDFVKTSLPSQRYICHCEGSSLPYLGRLLKSDQNIVVLIGPEGDFSSDEILLAVENGFVEASLGQERLRLETAGIVASQIVKTILNIN